MSPSSDVDPLGAATDRLLGTGSSSGANTSSTREQRGGPNNQGHVSQGGHGGQGQGPGPGVGSYGALGVGSPDFIGGRDNEQLYNQGHLQVREHFLL